MNCKSLFQIFITLAVLSIAGPASARPAPPFRTGSILSSGGRRATDVHTVAGRIMNAYRHWKGVHYLWGGQSRDGIDCSALIQKIFREALARQLPRTTAEQIKEGKNVRTSELKAGDLIFFQTEPGIRHVGVYVGEHWFIHASGSRGVTVSTLENACWAGHFEAARRVTG